tara:strand:+ start:4962 stop:5654 length:693 start_codon:yes stop_codon:yes gene_type:complete
MLLRIGILLFGISSLIGMAARQFRLKREGKFRLEDFSLDLTGAELARRILSLKKIEDVEVVESRALLTNHYDLRTKTLKLAPENFHGQTLAAAGIAAHEAGHAIQHAAGHKPLLWRQSAIKSTAYLTTLFFAISLPLMVIRPRVGMAVLGGSWSMILLQNILTMPVEFDASGRAKDVIYNTRLLKAGKEFNQLEEMLHAATLDKLGGFARFWAWAFSWIFPWRRRAHSAG